MNAQQRALVRQTFEGLRPIPKEVGVRFYDRLFELDPTLRPLFTRDLENQAAMFVTAVHVAVLALVDEGYVPPSLRELGARHESYGVPESAYATFGEALLWTLEQQLGEGFTLEVREAWAAAYENLASSMKQAAAEVRERRKSVPTFAAS